jgi:hypothetical protein
MDVGAIRSGTVPAEEKIMRALEDPKWDWRTIEGISRETGVPPDEVRRFLYRSGRILVRSPKRDRQGRALFTTRKRYGETHSLIERLLDHYRRTST